MPEAEGGVDARNKGLCLTIEASICCYQRRAFFGTVQARGRYVCVLALERSKGMCVGRKRQGDALFVLSLLVQHVRLFTHIHQIPNNNGCQNFVLMAKFFPSHKPHTWLLVYFIAAVWPFPGALQKVIFCYLQYYLVVASKAVCLGAELLVVGEAEQARPF